MNRLKEHQLPWRRSPAFPVLVIRNPSYLVSRAPIFSHHPDEIFDAPDDLAAAIDRVEAKRAELEALQPQARATAKVLTMLPKAATMYRGQIEKGLDGDAHAAGRARAIPRQLFGGEIRLEPRGPQLWAARWNFHPAVLLKAAVGTDGSGGRI